METLIIVIALYLGFNAIPPNTEPVEIIDKSFTVVATPEISEDFETLPFPEEIIVAPIKPVDVKRNTILEILGGLDFYVGKCGELTTIGKMYVGGVVEEHDIDLETIGEEPLYIKGQENAWSYQNCQALYIIIKELGGGSMVRENDARNLTFK